MDRADIAEAKAEAEVERLELELEELKKRKEAAKVNLENAYPGVIARFKAAFAGGMWSEFVQYEKDILYCVSHKEQILSMDKQAKNYEEIVAVTKHANFVAEAVSGLAKKAQEMKKAYGYDPIKQAEIIGLTPALTAVGEKIDEAMKAASVGTSSQDALPSAAESKITE